AVGGDGGGPGARGGLRHCVGRRGPGRARLAGSRGELILVTVRYQGSEGRPDLELRLRSPDHLIGELRRSRVAGEVGCANAVGIASSDAWRMAREASPASSPA